MRAASLSILMIAGCSSILPKAPPQSFYDLRYDREPERCARPATSGIEVWEFTADAPYDGPDMVVTAGREVARSEGHQWVGRPGEMVAAALMRDLNQGGPFTVALSPRDPEGAPFELTGNLSRFAWAKDGAQAHAELEADVVLRRTGDGARVLLHKRYAVRSQPYATTDEAKVFARAMSEVMARFSSLVRQDLCSAVAAPAEAAR